MDSRVELAPAGAARATPSAGMFREHPTRVNREVMDELISTGAVVGRRTFDLADGWGGDHHDGVPVFIPTRRPADAMMRLAASHVPDAVSAMRMAKDAAAEQDWAAHGRRRAVRHLRYRVRSAS